jgi:hypothetical protein
VGTLPASDNPLRMSFQHPPQFEWSAQHLHYRNRPVHSWKQVQVLIGHVGKTEWSWLTVQSIPTAHRRRRPTCTGFADVLTVDICDLDVDGRSSKMRRLGTSEAESRWVDVGSRIDLCPRVYESQVLPAHTVAVAFQSWLELGHVYSFNCEDI